MDDLTITELLKEIRKPGKVYVGMLTQHDCAYIAVEKADLIDWIGCQPSAKTCSDLGLFGFRDAHSAACFHVTCS